jgi:hypothetical protein
MDLSRNRGWTGHGQVLLKSRRHHVLGMVDVAVILHELERVWEAGSLPGKQSCEHNAALRELWRELQQQPITPAPAHLRLVS